MLDASAVLAYLLEEKGEDVVEAAFGEGPCRISAVNLCEVLGKLCEKGTPLDEARATVSDLGVAVVAFDEALAIRAASLRVRTKSIGASLGDRACLALAEQSVDDQAIPVVYTAEHAWTRFRWPFKIAVIR